MPKQLVLIIDDDTAIRNLLGTVLELHGYQWREAASAQLSIQELVSYKPQLVLLDLGLPDMDGTDLIRKVRSWSTVPIIVVSARSEDKDKIAAFDAGADDYITKPFNVDELLARVRAVLRRIQYEETGGTAEAVFTNGGLRIDYTAATVQVDGAEIRLTPLEYKLLCLLAKNVGKVLLHRFLLKELWGEHSAENTGHLRVFMTSLRKKIGQADLDAGYIQTHIGVGYRMIKL